MSSEDCCTKLIRRRFDPGWGYGGYGGVRYPFAAGLAVGAIAGAAIGSRYYALPMGCSAYWTSYYYCGGAYYEPQYVGNTVEYVVVDRPPGGPEPTP